MNVFLRITIGKDDVFYWGGDNLVSFDMMTCEGGTPNTCSFVVYDPKRVLADRYFTVIREVDGLTPVIADPPEGDTPAASAQGTASGDLSAHERAFLDATAAVEAGPQGYQSLVGGGSFTDMTRHPRVFNAALNSDAAGRYQFLSSTWDEVAGDIGATGFTSKEQDRGAVFYARQRMGEEAFNDAAGNPAALISGLGNVWLGLADRPAKFTEVYNRVYKQQPQQQANTDSVADKQQAPKGVEVANTGQQITVELGTDGKVLSKYSFIHVGLRYDLYDQSLLTFDGASATVVMTHVTENAAYQNTDTKTLFSDIAKKHGLKLEMDVPGEQYTYIVQRNQTDMEFIKREATRLGLVLTAHGNKLIVSKRKATPTDVVFRPDNVVSFSVSHQAGTGGKGARTPKDDNAVGSKKNTIDTMSGTMSSVAPDYATGTSMTSKGTTGTHVAENKPVGGGAGTQGDRVKGIVLNVATPLTKQLIEATVDNAVKTEGFAASFLDRYWVLDVIHTRINDSGYMCECTAYTPTKDKSPQQGTAATGDRPPLNPSGHIAPMAGYSIGDGLGAGRNHGGVDLAAPDDGRNVWASQAGVVTYAHSGCVRGDTACEGRYGNSVDVDHGNGVVTRYAHLDSVSVTVGQSVAQGQTLGTQGSTGGSTGAHLHYEFIVNGVKKNPADYVKL